MPELHYGHSECWDSAMNYHDLVFGVTLLQWS